jgi:hypothetical protein
MCLLFFYAAHVRMTAGDWRKADEARDISADYEEEPSHIDGINFAMLSESQRGDVLQSGLKDVECDRRASPRASAESDFADAAPAHLAPQRRGLRPGILVKPCVGGWAHWSRIIAATPSHGTGSYKWNRPPDADQHSGRSRNLDKAARPPGAVGAFI